MNKNLSIFVLGFENINGRFHNGQKLTLFLHKIIRSRPLMLCSVLLLRLPKIDSELWLTEPAAGAR